MSKEAEPARTLYPPDKTPDTAGKCVCGKPAPGVCGGCGQGYCSRDCQKKDWPVHKETCKTTRAAAWLIEHCPPVVDPGQLAEFAWGMGKFVSETTHFPTPHVHGAGPGNPIDPTELDILAKERGTIIPRVPASAALIPTACVTTWLAGAMVKYGQPNGTLTNLEICVLYVKDILRRPCPFIDRLAGEALPPADLREAVEAEVIRAYTISLDRDLIECGPGRCLHDQRLVRPDPASGRNFCVCRHCAGDKTATCVWKPMA